VLLPAFIDMSAERSDPVPESARLETAIEALLVGCDVGAGGGTELVLPPPQPAKAEPSNASDVVDASARHSGDCSL